MKIGSRSAVIMLIICSILWSTAGLLIKLLPWNAMVISGARSAVAAAVFVVYMRLRGLKFKLNRQIAFSGLMLCLTMFLFIAANKLTASANAIILQSASPVFIVVISAFFLKQRYARKDYFAVGCTMLGISLFFLDEISPGNMLGNILAVMSGITFASMYVFTNRLPDDDSALSSLLFGHLVSAVIGLPFAAFFRPEVNTQTITVLLLLGIFQLGIPYLLYGLAIRKCRPLYGALLGMLEPLMNPVWVFLMMGELPGLFAVAGGLVVLITVGAWGASNAAHSS